MTRYVWGILGSNFFCVGLAAVTGGVAHLIGANLAPDLYSIAVGDGLLPPVPVESQVWGPFLLGMFVSWWFGFIAAPFVFAASLFGTRRSLVKPLLWYFSIAIATLLAGSAISHFRNPYLREVDLGDLLVGLLDWGYLILSFAFAAFAVARWRGRDKSRPDKPPTDFYPRPEV